MADDDARARRTTKAPGAPGKKAAAKKAPARNVGAEETPARTGAARKAAKAGDIPLKRAASKKAAPATGKAPTKRAAAARKEPAASKAPAAKRPARKAGAVLAPREKKAPPLRLAAEQTFADDLEPPAPPTSAEDPGARMRAVLRAAAAQIEGRAEPSPATAAGPGPSSPPTPPPPPSAPDEPVTRVLVAPIPPEPHAEAEEELEAGEDVVDEGELEEEDVEVMEVVEVVEEEDEEGDWSPPDVLESPEPPGAAPHPGPAVAPPRDEPAPTVVMSTPSSDPAPTVQTAPAPPAWEPPAPDERKGGDGGGGGGAGTSILAIVLALVVPVLGAIIGLVLASRGRRRGARLSGPARIVSVLALVGWLVGGGVFAYVTLRDQGVDYSQLKVGDCFDSSPTNEVRGVKVKSCAEPHNSEIFHVVTHPAGPDEPYPGKDALVQFAADACLGQPLVDYLGIPLEQSQLKDFEIVPQESAWEDGRRLLVCGVDTGGQGQITGSVKGSRR